MKINKQVNEQTKRLSKNDRIKRNILNNKDLSKQFFNSDIDTFIESAYRYIKAIKEGRMLCVIKSVSNSGMSRKLAFYECSKGVRQHNYLNFYFLFKSLGYNWNRNVQGFQVNGCGMDMVFATNYNNIHALYQLGFISKKQCSYY